MAFAAGLWPVSACLAGQSAPAQAAGRLLRAAAVAAAVYGFGREGLTVLSVWTATVAGLPGLALQWILIPLTMYWIARLDDRHA